MRSIIQRATQVEGVLTHIALVIATGMIALARWVNKHFQAALARLAIWQQRARTRRTLLEMSDYQLKDIGITRCDALNESIKPFWKE